MTKVNNIIDSFKRVADIAFENLSPDVAVYHFIYVRDRNDRTKDRPDWKCRTYEIMKGATVYDTHCIRELIDKSMNGD